MPYKFELTTEQVKRAVIYSLAVETSEIDPPSRDQASKAFDRWIARVEGKR